MQGTPELGSLTMKQLRSVNAQSFYQWPRKKKDQKNLTLSLSKKWKKQKLWHLILKKAAEKEFREMTDIPSNQGAILFYSIFILPIKILFQCVFTIVQQVCNYSSMIAHGTCFNFFFVLFSFFFTGCEWEHSVSGDDWAATWWATQQLLTVIDATILTAEITDTIKAWKPNRNKNF